MEPGVINAVGIVTPTSTRTNPQLLLDKPETRLSFTSLIIGYETICNNVPNNIPFIVNNIQMPSCKPGNLSAQILFARQENLIIIFCNI